MSKRVFVKLCAGVIILIGITYSNGAAAGVNISVGVNVPPPSPLVIAAPPRVFVIPGTYAYFAPDVDVDIFFYHGYWYRPYRGYWYRSGSYNGKWVYIGPNTVPSVLLNLPPDFRRVPPGRQHISYGHLKKNWKTWERERHWEKRGDLDHDRGRGHKGS